MKYYISSITLLMLIGTLGGCGGGSSGSNSDTAVTDTSSNNNTLVNIANIDANRAADNLNNADQLKNDIDTLFGTANAEPIAIGDNENLSSVINRVQNTAN